MSELETKDELVNSEVDEANRQEVIDRDNGQCVICGKPTHEVHHIDPKGMGGTSDSESESLWNKATVCRNHHDMDHSGDIDMEFVQVDGEYILEVDGHDGRIWFNERPEQKAGRAEEIHDMMMDSFYTIQKHFWLIGGCLSKMESDNLYEGLGYDNFKSYLESPEIPISYDSGRKILRVRNTMEREIQAGNIDLGHVIEMGLEKASRICQFSGEEHFEEWAHKAITLPQDELKSEIRDSKSGEPKSLEESFDDESDDVPDHSERMSQNMQNDDRPSGEPEQRTKVDTSDVPNEVEKLHRLTLELCQAPGDVDVAEELWKSARDFYANNFT